MPKKATLTEKQIFELELDGWEIESRKPFKMVRYAQFAGGIHTIDSEEAAIQEAKDIPVRAKCSAMLKKMQVKLAKKHRDLILQGFEKCVRNFLTIGITQDTLLSFYRETRELPEFTNKELRKHIQKVFDQEDPGV